MLLPLDSIQILPNRQRREFDASTALDLSESIRTKGLLHAPVVRATLNGYALVAGERRLRAMRDIWDLEDTFEFDGASVPSRMVPVVFLSELDEIEIEEAELEENTVRSDLTWQEKADAISRLHGLRNKQKSSRGEVQSVAETALEVEGRSDGAYHNKIRKTLIVSRYLDKPEVAAAKSIDEAFKIVKRAEERTRDAAISERIGLTFNKGAHELVLGDAIEWLSVCPTSTFDLILTDPPYGINADSFGDAGGSLAAHEHAYDDSYTAWLPLMERFAAESFRVAKTDAHLYAFCDIDRYHELKGLLTLASWRVHRTPLVWHKLKAHRVPWPDKGPRRHYELILFAVKGNRNVNYISGDVISTDIDANLGHAAQKPCDIYRELLKRSAKPGDRTLDPFCGTGTIFDACHALQLAAVGIEIDPSNHGIAAKRLEALS